MTRTAGENVGTYAILQGSLSAANYTLSYVGANLTITPKPITVTADAKSKVYGSADPALTYQVTSGALVGTDGFSGALSRSTGENVGTYPILQGTLTAGTNYTLTYVGANMTITPAPLTINPGNASRVYGDPNPSFTFTYSGLVNGDSTIATPPTCSTSTPATAGVGSYATITCSGAASPNYSPINYGPNGTLTITPRPITVTADAKSKVYGSADPSLTYQVTSGSLVAGDSFSGALTRTAGENVGTYAILQGSLSAANYTLSYVGANLTITPKPITVTADAKSKVYGSADPALTYQVTSGALVGTDSFSGTLSRSTGENVGTYSILQGTLTAGTNYTLTYVGANLTITPAPLTINPGNASRVYGDPNPSFTFTYASLVNGDSTIATPPTCSTSTALNTGVGSYPTITCSGAASPNYSPISYGPNGTLTITPRPITVTADAKSKVYGSAGSRH